MSFLLRDFLCGAEWSRKRGACPHAGRSTSPFVFKISRDQIDSRSIERVSYFPNPQS